MCHKPLHSLINFAGYLAAPINGPMTQNLRKRKTFCARSSNIQKREKTFAPGPRLEHIPKLPKTSTLPTFIHNEFPKKCR